MSNHELLELRGIGKRFPGVVALAGVDFTVRAGEIHALLGENGAGKSTLIKVLTGVYSADEGKIRFDGKNIAPRAPKDAELLGISTVYQEVNLVPSLSVAENITLGRQPGALGFLNWRAIRRRAKAALARLEVDVDVDVELGSLSVAMQQMVAIARALDTQAKLLVLDEPTASLDEKEVAELFKVMRKLRGEGLGLVFVTHFLDQVYAVTDRLTVLRNGQLVGEYSTAELTRLQLVGKMLGREVHETDFAASAAAFTKQATTSVLGVKNFGRRGAVAPMDLSIAAGEVVGLGGLLGSGRTETARLLFGIDQADSGELRVKGASAKIRTPRDAVAQGLAFCSEDRKAEGILPNLSVRENLILALQGKRGALRPLGRTEQEQLCEHYIRALRIKTADAEVPIKNLSGGNQQKVLLARWLATQPAIIILDEPTRGIDIGAKQEIEQLIAKLRDDGLAVVFISSEIEEVVRNCSRVLVLRERKLTGEVTGAELNTERLMQLMAGTHEA
ncbi:sugar ABC transporter ATP-binding protein [Oleiharenicola lentus]|uniref:sugar ABC transporter ATP-binding protein n=1 Tax=Oleiharenicola lentus TaxID=2508720 RepID=UPI003F669C15